MPLEKNIFITLVGHSYKVSIGNIWIIGIIPNLEKNRNDANGNQVSRLVGGVTQTLVYNAENRLSGVSDDNGNSETYLYDGDGVRVGRIQAGVATYLFMGGMYEISVSIPDGTVTDTRSYYTTAGQVIAVRDSDGLSTLLTDHLGSILGDCPHVASPALAGGARDGYRKERSDPGSWGLSSANCGYLVAESGSIDGLGTLMGEQRYLPFGEDRGDVGSNPSLDMSFTGQRALVGTGLIDYKARQYDPSLRTFIQPDSIIPNPYDVQDWNRYSYVHGNPVNYVDPTGNRLCDGQGLDGECDSPTLDDWKAVIELTYHWTLDGDKWTSRKAEDILDSASRLSKGLSRITGSDGDAWIRRNLGNVSLFMGAVSDFILDHIRQGGSQGMTPFRDQILISSSGISDHNFIHEMGHILDNRAKEGGILPAVISGGGAADTMVSALDGNPSGCFPRFYCLSSNRSTVNILRFSFSITLIQKMNYLNYVGSVAGNSYWDGDIYANLGIAEDFSEVFTSTINDNYSPFGRRNWMENFLRR